MLKKLIVGGLMMLAVPSQASAETWLCIADMSSGFKFDKVSKTWRQVDFTTKDSRLIIKPAVNKAWKYEVTRFGEEDVLPTATCKNEPSEYGFLNCSGLFGELKFNTKNLRYIQTFIIGYVEILPSLDLVKEGANDPNIEIGRCSKL